MNPSEIHLEQWLHITIDSLRQALDKYDIGKLDGRLWRSIRGEIIHSGKSADEIILKFLQYGRFVDMGAGRGRPQRKKKPWFSKTKTREVARLRELLIQDLQTKTLQEMEALQQAKIEFEMKS